MCLVSSDGVSLPGGLITTPVLVNVDGMGHQQLVRVHNPTNVRVTIPAGTVMANMESVEIAQVAAAVKEDGTDDLTHLFKLDHLKDNDNISPEQLQAVQDMLNQNKDAISLHEFDLGKAKAHRQCTTI